MTLEDARWFGWNVAEPVVGFLLLGAAFLLGLALLKEITR